MKVVVVSQRVDAFPDRNEIRDALDQRMIDFLFAAGYLAMPVPNNLFGKHIKGKLSSGLAAWLNATSPCAVVLSGGNDIGQITIRDSTEKLLLQYAYTNTLPVLGICRGMQMIAHWFGVELHKVNGHVSKRHKLIGKINREVNSYHSYSLMSCPENFEVLARSEDWEIEAIRHLKLPWNGWMWHPERESQFSNQDIACVRSLFD